MLYHFENVRSFFKPVNESKFIMGVLMIFLNVASKYVELGFSKTQEQALRNGLGRKILIFGIAFTATKDLVLAIIITASFEVLSQGLFHEESRFCLMPERMKRISKLIDTNKDGVISKEEEDRVIKILENAEKQEKMQKKEAFQDYKKFNYM
jgi:hypothetical protein